MVESERIKKTIKDVCEEEGHKELSSLMFQILDYVRTHENVVAEVRDDNVKDIINQMEETTDENS